MSEAQSRITSIPIIQDVVYSQAEGLLPPPMLGSLLVELSFQSVSFLLLENLWALFCGSPAPRLLNSTP